MPKSEPLVSVVIPVWNTGESVKKLINKLFSQTYKNLEIIAIDDGSSDDSLCILQNLAKNDTRLKVIHQKNAGASAARNAGIEMAQGKYILFIDSDDDVTEDFVEKLVQRIESDSEVDLVVTGMRFNKLHERTTVDVYTKPHHTRHPKERKADYLLGLLIHDGRMYSAVNKVFRLKLIKELGLKFEEGRDFAEDTKFVLDYLERMPGEIGLIFEPLYVYNFGTDTSTVKSSSTIWENWEKSYADLKNWVRSVSAGKIYLKSRMLLGLVKLRWRVSHYRAKKRARS